MLFSNLHPWTHEIPRVPLCAHSKNQQRDSLVRWFLWFLECCFWTLYSESRCWFLHGFCGHLSQKLEWFLESSFLLEPPEIASQKPSRMWNHCEIHWDGFWLAISGGDFHKTAPPAPRMPHLVNCGSEGSDCSRLNLMYYTYTYILRCLIEISVFALLGNQGFCCSSPPFFIIYIYMSYVYNYKYSLI